MWSSNFILFMETLAAQTGSTSLQLYLCCIGLWFWITASITFWLLLAKLLKVCSCSLYLMNSFPFHHWPCFWSLLISTYKIFSLYMPTPSDYCVTETYMHIASVKSQFESAFSCSGRLWKFLPINIWASYAFKTRHNIHPLLKIYL